jgi:hypothetical protein
LSNTTAELSRPVPNRKRLLGSGVGTLVEAENDVISFTPLRLCEVSTKFARPIPLTIPDIVNVPAPVAFRIVSPGIGPIETMSEMTLVTTKEAVSPFSVIVKLPFGLMLNGVPGVKKLKDPIDPAATLAGLEKVIAPADVYESLPVMLRMPEIVSAHANEAEAVSTTVTASIIFKFFIKSSLNLSMLGSQMIRAASDLSSLLGATFFSRLKPNECACFPSQAA